MAYEVNSNTPKAIKISLSLWKELKNLGLIENKDVAAFGIFELGYKLPFYKDSILLIDLEMDGIGEDFLFPPQSR